MRVGGREFLVQNYFVITDVKILLIFIILVGLVFLGLYYILNNEKWKIGIYTSKYETIKNRYTFIAIFFILTGIATGITEISTKQSVNSFFGSLGASFVILGVASFGIDFLLHKEFMSVIQDISSNVDAAISTSTLNYSHGLIVHPNHHNVMARDVAISRYLRPGNSFRVISANADKYFQKGSEARHELEKRITENDCRIKGLIYFPVFDADREFIRIGPKLFTPERIMNEHKTLKEDYLDLISKYPNNVSIKFFTLPIHLNAMIIGEERAFSALVMHNNIGRNLPCFEMFPAGSESLIHKLILDFDFIFNNPNNHVTVDINIAYKIYEHAKYEPKLARTTYLRYLETTKKSPKS